MPWKWYDSKVVKIEDHSPNTKSFWVEVDSEEPIDFKPGQFVTMDLPIHERRTKRWRSYSIANHPDGSNLLEFCIVKLEGGAGTKYLFEEVTVGSEIRFKGPSGMFVLPDELEKDVVFLCTGTGVAPFRSMLWDIYSNKKPHKKLHLIFGTRHEENLLYKKEFQEFEKKIPGFKYSVALSREDALPALNGTEVKKGYIHQFYLNAYKEVNEDLQFYICGWQNMIDEAVENLILKLGYDKKQVKYELYG